jgi:dihydrofolate synthase/folylpolyglutamate synthase
MNIDQWSIYIRSLHNKTIDLGLDRIKIVFQKLGLKQFCCPIVTITGTNGKGSVARILESIYSAANYKVGVFSSPYFHNITEQIRLNNFSIQEKELLHYFEVIDKARESISLTIFEFTTLAALIYFYESNPDIIILEVGMGGRRDAVNIIDSDIAVITNIELEHQAWLGNSIEEIGCEKAGVFRIGKKAVFGSKNMPKNVFDLARNLDVEIYQFEKDFYYIEDKNNFSWNTKNKKLNLLPKSNLLLQNVSTSLMVVELFQNRISVSFDSIQNGLIKAYLRARFEIIKTNPTVILDVAHNPAAAKVLVNNLIANGKFRKTLVVFSMLSDKDILSFISILNPFINEWFIATLQTERAASKELLEKQFLKADIKNIKLFDNIKNAYDAALVTADKLDRIVVTGSFNVISEMDNTK